MVKQHGVKYALLFFILLLSVMAVHQGRALDSALGALEKAKTAPPSLLMSVLNVQTEKSVTLSCKHGLAEGGTDYTMSVSTGKGEPIVYSCVHQTQDVLGAQ